MSLVGPRPALPKEVAEFPPELRDRESVTPGITGLWQVEARDNPSFEAYRRLDLFYVENWSIVLDLMIMIGTVEQLVVKLFATIRPGKAAEPATITTLAETNRFGDGTDLSRAVTGRVISPAVGEVDRELMRRVQRLNRLRSVHRRPARAMRSRARRAHATGRSSNRRIVTWHQRARCSAERLGARPSR